MNQKGPVAEWLLRAAKECGSPERMIEEARVVSCANTRFMLETFAQRWQQGLRLNAWLGVEKGSNGKA